jgi:transcriptional regulator of acetoin/glycerol metabolism
VVIPMADAGGGPDWPMQYSLADRTQSSAGFIVPPFVRKKIAAILKKNEKFQADSGPVLVAGIIDESGKVKSLRALRPQDTRAQPAIVALQQWEFLPAQLDGRAVATRILIGVTVITEMTEK